MSENDEQMSQMAERCAYYTRRCQVYSTGNYDESKFQVHIDSDGKGFRRISEIRLSVYIFL